MGQNSSLFEHFLTGESGALNGVKDITPALLFVSLYLNQKAHTPSAGKPIKMNLVIQYYEAI